MIPDIDANGVRRYGKWAGNPAGDPLKPEHCREEIYVNYIPQQCTRTAGHGRDSEFCKTHARRYPQGKTTAKDGDINGK